MVWRSDFLSGVHLIGQTSKRLPVDPSDPVVLGEAAIELSTGGLWASVNLEVLAANTRVRAPFEAGSPSYSGKT